MNDLDEFVYIILLLWLPDQHLSAEAGWMFDWDRTLASVYMAVRVAGWCVNDSTSIQLCSSVYNCDAAQA